MPTPGITLALNSGSSSLKVGCFALSPDGTEALQLTANASGIGRAEGSLEIRSATGDVLLNRPHISESQDQAFERIATALRDHLPTPPIAIGHRVVHGGPKLREHQRITPEVIAQLQAAVHLAPLHIPEALQLIQNATKLYPETPQFACFDTTFHRTMPDVATHLPIPAHLFAEGVQRYGFHGLSCESVMHRLAPNPPARVVIAHLGNGSSVTAVQNAQSIDTSMGLSPTGGILMGTRTGDLDPGVLLYLQRQGNLTPDALEHLVNHDCGLAGLSGGESDMQALLQREAASDQAAALAVNSFCTAIRKQIGSYAALLGGLDLLVFTGGIGEHSAAIRNRVTADLNFLFATPDKPAITALPSQEEQQIAIHCRELLNS